jgi:hypothetical protein
VKKTNIVIIARLIVAVTFLFSATSKLIAPGLFEITLIDQGIAEDRLLAAYLTRYLIGFEFALGLLFIQPFYQKKLISPLTILLLIVFSGHLVYLMMTGDTENCGCFGDLVKMTPFESIIKNAAVLALTVFIFMKSESGKTKLFLPLALTIIPFILVFLIAPVKSIENFPFAKYTHFENKGRTDLSQGDILLGVFNLDCDHCQDAAKEMGELKRSSEEFPDVYVLFYSDGFISVDSFNAITNTSYPFHMIDVDEFFNLIGNSPPRVYWLQNGAIKEYWNDKFEENIEKSFDLK